MKAILKIGYTYVLMPDLAATARVIEALEDAVETSETGLGGFEVSAYASLDVEMVAGPSAHIIDHRPPLQPHES